MAEVGGGLSPSFLGKNYHLPTASFFGLAVFYSLSCITRGAEKGIFFSKRGVSSDTNVGGNLASVAKFSIVRAFSGTDADALS